MRSLQFNHSDMYLTVIASAVVCVFVTKAVIDRLPAKQYSCPVCGEDFGADALDSEAQLEHAACGTSLKVVDGRVVRAAETAAETTNVKMGPGLEMTVCRQTRTR